MQFILSQLLDLSESITVKLPALSFRKLFENLCGWRSSVRKTKYLAAVCVSKDFIMILTYMLDDHAAYVAVKTAIINNIVHRLSCIWVKFISNY